MFQIGKKYDIHKKIKEDSTRYHYKKICTGELIYICPHLYVFVVKGKRGSYRITYTKSEVETGDIKLRPR